MNIEISKLKPNPNNPRLIKDDKYRQLIKSIKEFPEMLELRPVVVNKDMVVLGGNMRLKACKEAGLSEIPYILAENLTPEQEKEFLIKDNVSFGENDWAILANEWDTDKLIEWGMELPLFNSDDLTDEFSLADGDKEPFQQMTFTLADAQAERIKESINDVQVQDGTEYGNENGNGNALHQIILEWGEQKK